MNRAPNNLSSTMEDYLEAILTLKEENGVARVGEVAARLNVKSPTVNSAIKSLSEQNLVVHQKYGYVDLTKAGEKVATEVKKKHEILFRFLTEFLLLDPKTAENEACCIEHAISKETFVRLTKFFNFVEMGLNNDKPKILQQFDAYLKNGKKGKSVKDN